VRAALDRATAMRALFDPEKLRAHARRYDRAVFERRFRQVIDEALASRRGDPAPRARAAAPQREAWS
jgi:hypothetical protein